MANSSALWFPGLTCAQCGGDVDGTSWQLVDVEERPDLRERIVDGTIDEQRCRQCGVVARRMTLPLVIYRPHEDPRLILSTPGREITGRERDLVLRVVDRLGRSREEVVDVPGDLVPLALDSGIEAVAAEQARQSALVGAVTRLINSNSRTLALRWIGRSPELLGDEADHLLEQWLKYAVRRGQADLEVGATQSLKLLRLCRAHGVDAVMDLVTRRLSEAESAALDRLDREQSACRCPDDNPRALRICREALDLLPADRTDLELAELEGRLRLRVAALSVDGAREQTERAVDAFEEALQLLPPEAGPHARAGLQYELGTALLNRRAGDRAENVERAVALLSDALRAYRASPRPPLWAATLAALGSARLERMRGRRATNVERGLEELRSAFDAMRRDGTVESRAQTTRQLALALVRRPGDTAENTDEAIALLRPLAGSLARRGSRCEWAATTLSLGTAYARQRRGSRARNLGTAIAAYRRALRVLTPELTPLEWGLAMLNLGSALGSRRRESGGGAPAAEIACYEAALSVLTREDTPYEWSMAVMNLGVALKRTRRASAANRERAIERFTTAQQVLDRESEPFAWASLMDNLGTAFRDRTIGDRAENRVRAVASYRHALGVFRPDTVPDECRAVAKNLGDLYADRAEWRSARTAYGLGVRAAEAVYRSAHVPASRRAEAEANADLYDRAVDSCLRVGRSGWKEALLHAEAGKARTFLDQLGESDLTPPPGAPPDLLARERDLIAALRGTYRELSEPGLPARDSRRIARERAVLQAELDELWVALGDESPAATEYVALRRAASPTWEQLSGLARRLGSRSAVVEFFTLPDRIAAFVLRAGCDAPDVHELPLSEAELLYRYVKPYEHAVLRRQGSRRSAHDWLALGEALLAPLAGALDGADFIHLIPHGRLHLLPLHAATCGGRPFIADHGVAYAPSAGALARVLERPRGRSRPTPRSDLVLGYTSSASTRERRLLHGEARSVADILGCQALVGRDATLEAVRRLAPSATRIHLSCHGAFDALDPLSSFVELAGGRLTARDWMKLDLGADLVTLSACETAISDVGRGDELTGLTAALLSAGASSALVTLWSVDADATRDWMADFYGLASNGQDRATASREATLRLMDRLPDPYYWAPFLLVGAGE